MQIAPRRYRWMYRLMLLLAAAPLFQFSQCATGFRQVLGTVANNLPATVFQVIQSAILAPLFGLLGGGVSL